MPLLEAPPAHDVPLSQGDVIDVLLHVTSSQDSPDQVARRGLVISRECAVAHKPQVLVASVTEVKERLLKNEATKTEGPERLAHQFHRLREVLGHLRDGSLSPDRIYLGNLPGENAPLVAKLDEVMTVRLPDG